MKFLKIFLCVTLIVLMIGCKKNEIFSLDNKYYDKSSILDINNNTLEQLINDKESFAVFVYQPLCETSSGFESLLNNFINTYRMSFYKVPFSDIKNTDLGKTIKYYPSFIIYKDGKIVDYLEADNDEDTKYYKNLTDFTTWLSSYIVLGDLNFDYSNNEDVSVKEEIIDVEIDNISYDPNKVNIYLFWGDGCPHCENAINFIESITNEYGKYFKLNKFEVWHNENNKKIYQQFSSKMGDKSKGVPYIIIGEQSFIGFSSSYKEDIIKAITSQYKNSYDVYFSNKE